MNGNTKKKGERRKRETENRQGKCDNFTVAVIVAFDDGIVVAVVIGSRSCLTRTQ